MFRNDAIGTPWAVARAAGMFSHPAGSGHGAASQVSAAIDGACNVPATVSCPAAGTNHGKVLSAAFLWHQHHGVLSRYMTFRAYCQKVASSQSPAYYVRANGCATGPGLNHLKSPSSRLLAEADALRAAHPNVFRPDRPPPPLHSALVAAAAWQDDAGLRSRMKRMAFAREAQVDNRHLHHYVSLDGTPSKAMAAAIDRLQPEGRLELRNAAQALRERVFARRAGSEATGAPSSSVRVRGGDPRRLGHRHALVAALAWHQDHHALSGRMDFTNYCRRVDCGPAASKYVLADGTSVRRGAELFKNVPSDLQADVDELRARYPDVFRPAAPAPAPAHAPATQAAPPGPAARLWQPWASPWRPWSDRPAS